jgi:hypothetical protein
MGATNDTENLRKARIIVSERLRAYFAEIKAELDADSEEFFKRVMQQAPPPATRRHAMIFRKITGLPGMTPRTKK